MKNEKRVKYVLQMLELKRDLETDPTELAKIRGKIQALQWVLNQPAVLDFTDTGGDFYAFNGG